MTKDDIIRKLCSRKFWMALIGFIVGLLTYLGVGVERAEQLGSLILMAASVVAYILGEGLADAADARSDIIIAHDEEEKPPEAES